VGSQLSAVGIREGEAPAEPIAQETRGSAGASPSQTVTTMGYDLPIARYSAAPFAIEQSGHLAPRDEDLTRSVRSTLCDDALLLWLAERAGSIDPPNAGWHESKHDGDRSNSDSTDNNSAKLTDEVMVELAVN